MVWMINGLEFTWGSFLLHTSTSAFPDSTEEPEPTSWGNSMADWGTGRTSGQQQNKDVIFIAAVCSRQPVASKLE